MIVTRLTDPAWPVAAVCHHLPFAARVFLACLHLSCFQSAPLKEKNASQRDLYYCLFDADFVKMHWHIHIVLAGGSCA